MDVTRDEFWVYIAVTLLMGVIQKLNFDLYGQTMHFLKQKSSKDRSAVHLIDNLEQ